MKHTASIMGVLALLFLFLLPAKASTVVYNFSGVVANGPNGCGGGEGCSLDLPGGADISISFGTSEDECHEYICGSVDSGSVDFTLAGLSLGGNFVPGSGDFSTGEDGDCTNFNQGVDDLGGTAEFTGGGTGFVSIGISAACGANNAYLGDSVNFSISFTAAVTDPPGDPAPTPEPPTFALFGLGFGGLIFTRKLWA